MFRISAGFSRHSSREAAAWQQRPPRCAFPVRSVPYLGIGQSRLGYLAGSKQVAVALAKAESQSLPASVSAWGTLSGKKEIAWTPPSFAIGAAWTPDGHWLLATSSANAIHLWRIY
jgi:hypothetical protein